MSDMERDEIGRFPQIWTVEKALDESKKFKTRKEFRFLANSAYQYLTKKKKLHLLNFDKEVKKHRLPDWEVFCAAKKSNTRKEFREKYLSEYSAFLKRKHICNSLISHMPTSITSFRWTKKKTIDESKKFKSLAEFREKSPKAYDAAVRHKYIKYMDFEVPRLGSDADVCYMWLSDKKIDGMNLIKIGITSKRLGDKRIRKVCSDSGFKCVELMTMELENAFIAEKILLGFGKRPNLTPFPGSTEFRLMSKSEYKKAKEDFRWISSNAQKNGESKGSAELLGRQLALF